MQLQFPFPQFTIGSRLTLFFESLSLVLVLVFIAFLLASHHLQALTRNILDGNVSSIRSAYKLEIALANLRGLKAYYMLGKDPVWLGEFDRHRGEFNRWYNQAFQSAGTAGERDLLSALSIDFDHHLALHHKIIGLLERGDRRQAAELLLNDSNNTFMAINDGCEKLVALNEGMIAKTEQAARRFLGLARVAGMAAIAAFIGLGLALAVAIGRSITDPIRQMERASDTVLQPDPAGSDAGPDEMARLQARFERMVAALRASQEKLIRSEKQAVLGQMAAGVSHELNNPVGIISGFAELLLAREDLSDKSRQYAQQIHGEAQRCRRLLQEMLDFARPLELDLQPRDLRELLAETLASFRGRHRGVRFAWARPKTPVVAAVDYFRMKQVLVNLLLNAVEALPNGRGAVRLSTDHEKGRVVIRIRDNGPGIGPEARAKLFTPFFTTKNRGMGLGLALSKNIVEKHRGELKVDSIPGCYAEFVIALPDLAEVAA